MVKFVQGAMTGKVKNTFDSSPIEAELKNSLKLCGTDFESSIYKYNTHKDKLVLITHRKDSKNSGIEGTYDNFAKSHKFKNL